MGTILQMSKPVQITQLISACAEMWTRAHLARGLPLHFQSCSLVRLRPVEAPSPFSWICPSLKSCYILFLPENFLSPALRGLALAGCQSLLYQLKLMPKGQLLAFLPAACLVASLWELETGHGGPIDTTEMVKQCKSELSVWKYNC